jgi:hypothetical protein
MLSTPRLSLDVRKGGCRHGIAEDVVRPVDLYLRNNREIMAAQSQLAALSRPKHHPVRRQRDELLVSVARAMMNSQTNQSTTSTGLLNRTPVSLFPGAVEQHPSCILRVNSDNSMDIARWENEGGQP